MVVGSEIIDSWINYEELANGSSPSLHRYESLNFWIWSISYCKNNYMSGSGTMKVGSISNSVIFYSLFNPLALALSDRYCCYGETSAFDALLVKYGWSSASDAVILFIGSNSSIWVRRFQRRLSVTSAGLSIIFISLYFLY